MTAASYRRGGIHMAFKDDVLDGGDGNDALHGGPGDNVCLNGESTEDC